MSEWTRAKDEYLRAAIARGEPHAVISRRLGTTRNATIGRANRLGMVHPYNDRPSHSAVIALRKTGLTYRQIASITGFCAPYVGKICRGEVSA